MSRSCQSDDVLEPDDRRRRARRARGRRSARRPSGCACAASRRSPSCLARTAPRPRAPRFARDGGSRSRSARATSRSARGRRAARRGGRARSPASRADPARGRAARRRRARPRGRGRRSCRRCPRAGRRGSTRARAASRTRSRSSSNAQPASFQPNVVGSAWIPWVRPMQIVRRCSSACFTTASIARFEPGEDQLPGILDLEREGRVDDVRGGEAVVDPAALGPELLGDGIDESGGVVVGDPLDLGDALDARRLARRRESRRHPRQGSLLPRPSRRARRARPRASVRACPPPTRHCASRAGSSGRSRSPV